jgi:protein TonB
VAGRDVGPAAHPRAFWWGAGVALTLHALVAFGLRQVPAQGFEPERTVPIEIEVTPPPPLPEPPPPPPEPQPPAPEPRPPVRRHSPRLRPPPPMPNQTPPATATEDPAQPVFGVTPESVVPGESPVTVPVGNTLMTKDRTPAKAPPAPLPPAPPPPAFAPVDEDEVAEWPKELSKPDPTVEYPEAALRLGIGGRVVLRIGIDRKGNVKSARVVQKAGYGMDEEALKRIWKHRFTPARRANGEAVDFVLTYGYIFTPPPP